MRHFAVQIHYVQWRWRFCVDLRLLNACMKRVSRRSCANSAYVCIALCVWLHLKVLSNGVWHSMRSSFCPFCCLNTPQWQWWLCVDLRLFDIWNGYWVCPKPTARTFLLLLRLCSNLVVLLAFDAAWGRNISLPHHVLSNYTTMTMVILRWFLCVERVSYWPWTNKQAVRLYCCLRVRLNLNASVFSMQYEVVISP